MSLHKFEDHSPCVVDDLTGEVDPAKPKLFGVAGLVSIPADGQEAHQVVCDSGDCPVGVVSAQFLNG